MRFTRPARLITLGVALATAAAVSSFATGVAHADPTVTITGALPAAIGVNAVSFELTATNGTGTDQDNARYDFNIDTTDDPTLVASDLTLTYSSDGGSIAVPVTDTGHNPDTTGFFLHVPTDGFPFPAGDSDTPTFTLAANADAPVGSISTTMDLDAVDTSGAFKPDPGTIASDGPTTEVIEAAPTVTSVAPSDGPLAGGTPVTIDGSGFTGATEVDFGTVAASNVQVVSATEITADSPAVTGAGEEDVTVTAPGGTSDDVTADEFTYDAVPTVATVSPAAGPVAGGTPVTITGTGFTDDASVDFAGTAATTVTVSSDGTTITATTPAHEAGSVDVVVTTPGGPVTDTGGFTYDAPPTVTDVSPGAGPVAGATSVTITGTGLTGASVDFGSVAATGVTVNAGGTSLTATTPAHVAGSVDVVVTTPGGTDTDTGAFAYDAVPTVTDVSPGAGPVAGGTPVTITGTGFTDATTVDFGSSAATDVVVSEDGTSLTATSPAHAAGSVDVLVTTPGGATTDAGVFAYDPPPTVTEVSPGAGPVAGGTSVTITGTGLTGASVEFGSAAATGIAVNAGGTSLTATSPAHAAGSVDVTVTTPGGVATDTDAFVYDVAPVVGSVTPDSGLQDGGDSVTILGTGFTGATSVHFGSTAVDPEDITLDSDTSITVTDPSGAVGQVDVTVTGPGGTSATNENDTFTYTSGKPTITLISPSSGSQSGGTVVTITGTNLDGTTAVAIGGTAATNLDVSDTSITATTPSGDVGSADVTVTNGDGTATDSGAFTYVENPPTVTGISPATGFATGGTRVAITGTNFTVDGGDEYVTFDGPNGEGNEADVISGTATQVVVFSPPNAAGVTDVVVHNDVDDSSSSSVAADRFTYLATVPIIAVQGKGNSSLYVSTNGKPFVSYGGVLKGAPSVVSANDRNYYFVRGGNNDLYVRTDKTAFTHLRPGAPLGCQTAPEAVLESDDTFAIGCIGASGRLYTATGTLPAAGNPTISTLNASAETGLNNDLTKVKGGVGSDGEGEFVVTGAAYAASGPVSEDSDSRVNPAGNTFVIGVDYGDGTPNPVAFKVGGTCGGAPSVAYTGLGRDVLDSPRATRALHPALQSSARSLDATYVTCRGTTSAATVSYEELYQDVYDPATESFVDSVTTYAVFVGVPRSARRSASRTSRVTGSPFWSPAATAGCTRPWWRTTTPRPGTCSSRSPLPPAADPASAPARRRR